MGSTRARFRQLLHFWERAAISLVWHQRFPKWIYRHSDVSLVNYGLTVTPVFPENGFSDCRINEGRWALGVHQHGREHASATFHASGLAIFNLTVCRCDCACPSPGTRCTCCSKGRSLDRSSRAQRPGSADRYPPTPAHQKTAGRSQLAPIFVPKSRRVYRRIHGHARIRFPVAAVQGAGPVRQALHSFARTGVLHGWRRPCQRPQLGEPENGAFREMASSLVGAADRLHRGQYIWICIHEDARTPALALQPPANLALPRITQGIWCAGVISFSAENDDRKEKITDPRGKGSSPAGSAGGRNAAGRARDRRQAIETAQTQEENHSDGSGMNCSGGRRFPRNLVQRSSTGFVVGNHFARSEEGACGLSGSARGLRRYFFQIGLHESHGGLLDVSIRTN